MTARIFLHFFCEFRLSLSFGLLVEGSLPKSLAEVKKNVVSRNLNERVVGALAEYEKLFQKKLEQRVTQYQVDVIPVALHQVSLVLAHTDLL